MADNWHVRVGRLGVIHLHDERHTFMRQLAMVVGNGELHFYSNMAEACDKAGDLQGVVVPLPIDPAHDYRPWQSDPTVQSRYEAHRIQNGWPIVLGQCGHWWQCGPTALLGWLTEGDPDLSDCPTCHRPPGVILGTWRETWPDPSYRADLSDATESPAAPEPAPPDEPPPPPAVGRASLLRVPPWMPPIDPLSGPHSPETEPAGVMAGTAEPTWQGGPVGHGLAEPYEYHRDD